MMNAAESLADNRTGLTRAVPSLSTDRKPVEATPLCEQLFQGLSDEDIASIKVRMIRRAFPRNTTVLYEDEETDALYIILKGQVKITKRSASGKEAIISVLSAGDYFGEMALIDEGHRSSNAVTKGKCEICFVRRRDVYPVLMRNPQFMMNLMLGLSRRLREASSKIACLAMEDVYGRIAQLLRDSAIEKDGALVIEEKLSRQEIADRIGSSREMASRIFNDLLRGGYISEEGGKIRINRKLPNRW